MLFLLSQFVVLAQVEGGKAWLVHCWFLETSFANSLFNTSGFVFLRRSQILHGCKLVLYKSLQSCLFTLVKDLAQFTNRMCSLTFEWNCNQQGCFCLTLFSTLSSRNILVGVPVSTMNSTQLLLVLFYFGLEGKIPSTPEQRAPSAFILGIEIVTKWCKKKLLLP